MTQTQTQNSIMVINTYKHGTAWVFDDERVGLVKEPFVGGADTLIEAHDFNRSGKVTITFSGIPFPDRNVKLVIMNTVEEGEGGTTYFCPEVNHTVWLCPALLKYFTKPPKVIYAKLSQNS